jgi:hypothetical protein
LPRKALLFRHVVDHLEVMGVSYVVLSCFGTILKMEPGVGAFPDGSVPRNSRAVRFNFVESNEDDIRLVVGTVNTMKVRVAKYNGAETTVLKPVSDWTREGYKIALKRFYRWLRKKRRGQYVDETSWIEVTQIKSKTKASDLLSPDEILLLLRNQHSSHQVDPYSNREGNARQTADVIEREVRVGRHHNHGASS